MGIFARIHNFQCPNILCLNPSNIYYQHYSDKLAEVESTLKIISIPKDPAGSRKAVKEILDAAACLKPEASTSSIVQHLEAIR